MVRPLSVWLTIVVAIGQAGVTPTSVRAAGTATTPAADVGDARVVEISSGQEIVLSPDGRWLAIHRQAGEGFAFCAVDAVGLVEHSCATFDVPSIASWTARWSPDGMSVAFTEDLLDDSRASDLWIFAADSGRLTNLTDDGVTGRLTQDDVRQANPPVDSSPAWSPDGQELVYLSSQRGPDDVWFSTLLRLSPEGGESTVVTEIDGAFLGALSSPFWSPDDATIYYTFWANNRTRNGLWAVAAAGGTPRPVGDWQVPEPLPPILIAMTDDGNTLIHVEQVRLAQCDVPLVTYGILDPVTEQLDALGVGDAVPDACWIILAALSPTGVRLLLQYDTYTVVVRDRATDREEVVVHLATPLGSPFRAGAIWADNDLVFGPIGLSERDQGVAILLDLTAFTT